MSKNYRVIIPELTALFVGHHQSFGEHVAELQKFIEKIDDGSGVHIAASSYGGALSWALAIVAPKTVLSLALLSPMPPNPRGRFRSPYLRRVLLIAKRPILLYYFLKLPIGRRSLIRLAEIFDVPWLARKRVMRDKAPPSSRQLKVLTHVIHRFAQIISKEDWSFWESRLAFVQQSVCIIWGEDDKLYEESQSTHFLRLFNNGQLFHLQNAGHFSMSDNPLPVVYILDQFLTRFQKAA